MTQLQHHSPQPAWNFPELLLRVDNDQELLRDLLNTFREDFPPMMQSLRSAVAASDLKNTAAISHTMRGMLSNLAATRAAAAAAELEKLANAADSISLPGVLVRLGQETTSLRSRDRGLSERGPRLKTLIAEDDAIPRRLLQKALERSGYDVVAVENGKQALEALCALDAPASLCSTGSCPSSMVQRFAVPCASAPSRLTPIWFY
jgi:HPt (histidine-containing phosphotransfer) domain-containing protein